MQLMRHPRPRASARPTKTLATHAFDARRAAAAASAALVLLSAGADANADELKLRFKASPDPQVRAAQQQLVEAWALTSAFFVDADAIAKPEWHDGIGKALDKSFGAASGIDADGKNGKGGEASRAAADGVRALQDELLAVLGDPYTRVLRGAAAERLAAEEEGRVVGNGLALLPAAAASAAGGAGAEGQQQQQQKPQRWAVAYVAPGGPAEVAGVRVGDAVLEVDGAPPPTPPPPAAASAGGDARTKAFLARVSRQPVALRLLRAGNGEGAAAAAAAAAPMTVDARLSPAPVDVESVQWGVLRVPSRAMGSGSGSAQSQAAGAAAAAAAAPVAPVPVAYLRIAQFSQRTPAAVASAMDALFRAAPGGDGPLAPAAPRALLVDLRDDPGGVVEAAVEVARQLLRPGDALAVVTSRAGGPTAAETSSERVVLSPLPPAGAAPSSSSSSLTSQPPAPALYAGGRASTRLPTAVLTNRNTASTAELLAGALRDGGPGAVLVGERTYGKGRSQRVVPLQNGGGGGGEEEGAGRGGGATLLVSTMRFATPSGAPIDGVGLEPGVACSAPAAGFEVFAGGGGPDGDAGAAEEMRALLEGDACVRRAAELLAAKARLRE